MELSHALCSLFEYLCSYTYGLMMLMLIQWNMACCLHGEMPMVLCLWFDDAHVDSMEYDLLFTWRDAHGIM